MKIAVTGGRDFMDESKVWRALDAAHAKSKITLLVHGDATGVDTSARKWAGDRCVPAMAYPANWAAYGRSAGPRRNAEMASSGLDGCIAFPGGRGTLNMRGECEKAGVPVWAPYDSK